LGKRIYRAGSKGAKTITRCNYTGKRRIDSAARAVGRRVETGMVSMVGGCMRGGRRRWGEVVLECARAISCGLE